MNHRIYACILAVIGWLAVLAQLYLILANRVESLPVTLLGFISYFTILTNILIALAFTSIALNSHIDGKSFIAAPSTLAAITVNITIVAIVYNAVLRPIWNPQGLQRIVDELLHVVIPILTLFYWLKFVPKAGLKWSAAFTWLIYPLTYFVFVLIRGDLTGVYPYPFCNVRVLGYPQVFINCLLIAALFVGISLIFIALGRRVDRRRVS